MKARKYHAHVNCRNMSGYQVLPKCTFHEFISFDVQLPDDLNLDEIGLAVAFDREARAKIVNLADQQFEPLLEQMPTDRLDWHWTRDIYIYTLTCGLKLPTEDSPELVYDLFCIDLIEDAHKAQLFEKLPEYIKREHKLNEAP